MEERLKNNPKSIYIKIDHLKKNRFKYYNVLAIIIMFIYIPIFGCLGLIDCFDNPFLSEILLSILIVYILFIFINADISYNKKTDLKIIIDEAKQNKWNSTKFFSYLLIICYSIYIISSFIGFGIYKIHKILCENAEIEREKKHYNKV